ncbi:MAG: SGNH/GDSL hydrolase family protein [Candidatus Sumerlaeota bacterium]|nr:SGNH/GDSL hydrolase family protein [Candidatus Sumerlaeota bacterium]
MSDMLARVEKELARSRHTRAQIWFRRLTFAVLGLALPFMLGEIALRARGYYRPLIPMDAQAATNTACVSALSRRFDTDAFEPDRYLLWRLSPGRNLGGMDVTKSGLLGAEPSGAPTSGTVRVLCLGDSATAMTYRTYPQLAQRLVSRPRTGPPIEFYNAAAPGYTTEQGLRLFRRLRAVKPSVVVACFGWNDLFPALNLPDKELGARNIWSEAAQRIFSPLRLFQFAAAPAGERSANDAATSPALRVGPEQFARNLEQIVHEIQSAGALAVLATQPANLATENAGSLVLQNFAPDYETVRIRRSHYNSIVRSVCSATGACLLDFEEEFERRNREFLFDADGIHFSGPGHNLAARLLVGVLRNQGVISAKDFATIVRVARYDTEAPDKPHAAWILNPPHMECSTTAALTVGVIATNTGNTTFLKRNVVPRMGLQTGVEFAGVSITGEWRTIGAPTTTSALTRLSHDLLPGESTSTTLTFAAPPAPGNYGMEIGLRADGIGPLKNFGAEVTTLTVSVR